MSSKTIIIKPTYRCNYACEFCSTVGDEAETLEIDVLLDFINRLSKRHSTLETIINGGEPAIMGTEYYQKLVDSPVKTVSVQSNGELIYNNIEKWKPLLLHKKFGMGISFQLGNQRKNKKGVVFDKELFFKYQERFKQVTGEYMFFIYVMTDDNYTFDKIDEIMAISEKLNVGFRLSAIFKSGLGKNVYIPQYKAVEVFNYLLEEHTEQALTLNPFQPLVLSDGPLARCNYTPDCSKGIISIEPNGDLHTCCGLGDRYMKPVGHISDDIDELEEKINQLDLSHKTRPQCSSCHINSFCNSCYIRHLDVADELPEEQDNYCREMKRFHQNIYSIRKKLGLEPDIIKIYRRNREVIWNEQIAQ